MVHSSQLTCKERLSFYQWSTLLSAKQGVIYMCKEQNLLVYDESLSGIDGLVVVAETGLLAGLLSM